MNEYMVIGLSVLALLAVAGLAIRRAITKKSGCCGGCSKESSPNGDNSACGGCSIPQDQDTKR